MAGFLALTLLLTLLAGCSTGPEPLMIGQASSTQISADWDDLEAAVVAGASKARMAVLGCDGCDEPGSGTRVYRLITLRDRPALLRVERSDAGPLRLSARVGRFGDEARERDLIRWVTRRLEELRGVEVRRIDWLPSDILP